MKARAILWLALVGCCVHVAAIASANDGGVEIRTSETAVDAVEPTIDADIAAIRNAMRAARAARYQAADTATAAPEEPPACADGEHEWRIDFDAAFCAKECVTDLDCVGGEERCRVVDFEVLGAGAPVFAADVDAYLAELPLEEAAEADELVNALRVCDPFWEDAFAVLPDSVTVDEGPFAPPQE